MGSFETNIRSGSNRGGFTLVELIVAGVLLAMTMTLSVQMLSSVAQQRRQARQRQIATAEAANLMERITAQPYASITQDALQSWKLPDELDRRLPNAELEITTEETTQPPAGKRIHVTISWRNSKDAPAFTIGLTGWMFDQGEDAK